MIQLFKNLFTLPNPHEGRKEGELYGARGKTWIIENGIPVIWDSFYCQRKHWEYQLYFEGVKANKDRRKKASNRKGIRRQRTI